jgi:hypothetical protein
MPALRALSFLTELGGKCDWVATTISPLTGLAKSFLAGFENILRAVFHAKFFQQRDVFLAE